MGILTPISLGRRVVAGAGVLVREQIEYRELFIQMTKRDLLILITPHIIDEGQQPDTSRP